MPEEQPPRVLHLIDHLRIGGAQTHLLAFLKAARCVQRYEHLVCSLTEPGDIGEELSRLGVRVLAVDAGEALQQKRWWVVIRQLHRLLRAESVTILQAHLSWARLLGTVAAKWAGVPMVIALEQGDLYDGWQYRWANRIVQRWLTDLVTCSEAMKRWLVEHYRLDPAKITVMPGCVVVEEFASAADRAAVRRTLALPDHALVVGTIGTLGTGINKGVEWCLRATAQLTASLPETTLLVVGDGSERGRLEGLSRQLGLQERVRFLGSRRDIPALLQAMDIFLLASEFEPFGIVLVEAMCMKKPIVATATGGIPEVVEDGVTGILVPRGDYQRMAEAIHCLWTHPEMMARMGEAGRQKAVTRYSAQRYAEALHALYDRRLALKG